MNAKNTIFHCRGFTLIELMIVLLVLAILVAIAYPAYNSYVVKSRRAEGKALLHLAAQRQQQFFTSNNAFTDTIGSGGLGLSTSSVEGYYTLSVTATATTYTLTAAPAGSQTSDTSCGQLTLNHLGAKGISGSKTVDYCW